MGLSSLNPRRLLSSLTLEPVIFLYIFTTHISGGAKQDANLMMEKICETELNYTRAQCLARDEDEDVQVEVQKFYNM